MSLTAEADIALRDGSTVHVRPVHADDSEGLTVFLRGLSDEARTFRFFSAGTDVTRAAQRLADPVFGGGLVAVTSADGTIVGHGEYVGDGNRTAEVAFAIADAWQGHGIATLLLAQLAYAAAREGIETFTAVVMPDNRRMIDAFRASGFPVELRSQPGEIEVTFPTALTDEGRHRFEAREHTAAVAAVAHVLRPRSVAVIGASRRPESIGARITRNLVESGFAGDVFPINPQTSSIEGLPAFPSVLATPSVPELAVLAVPAASVVDAARECAQAGVRALVVVTSGFAESGEEGRERQRELLSVCRTAGMRMVGPNCLGVIDTDASLNASFAPGTPVAGGIGFASQSGAFGIASIDLARTRGIGLSSFVSLGDKADLSGNDFLQYWEDDEHTDVVALYLESFGNPRKFGRIARRLSSRKPVIVVKSGRSQAGQRAASSHTGALLAAADTSVDALFRHAGVIRTDTVGELFDVAALLSRQPLPAGDRVGIVTNAGGPGILCADACEARGLHVSGLGSETRAALAAGLPAEASVSNPVDLIASASPDDYARALECVIADPGVDAVIAIFVRPLTTRAADVDVAIRSAAAGAAKPMLAVFLGPDVPSPSTEGVPTFASVEEAALALAHAARYARHRAAAPDPPPEADGIDADEAAALIAEGLAAGGGWLPPQAVEALLRAYGLPLAASRWATTPNGVRSAAEALGGHVAVKAAGDGLLHKTELGAVCLDLTPTAAARAASDMRDRLTPDGFLVQRMAQPGPELIVGVVGDPRFGPLVAVGAGGATAEASLGDIQVRLAPVGVREAADMLRELRTFPLLEGYRGSAPVDVAAVEDVVVRIAALAAAHPEITELDCNPLIAGPDGAVIVDARIRLQPVPEPRPPGALDR